MIYTVGHSNYETDEFIRIISNYGIDIIVDIRSSPYSRYCPQFNKDTIKTSLNNAGFKYLFLGNELGAKPKDQSCYLNDKVSFEKLSKTILFRKGIKRILDGITKYNIAIMCTEKDPIDCHRAILVSKTLTNKGVTVKHIINKTQTLEHTQLEDMLLQKFNFEETLFDTENSKSENLQQAYKKQEELISYQEKESIVL